jgi:glutamine synthetase
MPKPIHGINGSGMHTHQSLYSIAEKRNAFADPSNAYGLSEVARSYMAGILAHARGMAAVLAPLVNSYKRLVPGYEAPTYLTWGRTNRSALIRVPKVSPGKSIEGTRAEVRCPDPSSNTYLAFAVMIAAGLDGVEKGLQLSDPVEESLFEMDAATIASKGILELPGTLGEAITELENDPVISEALGDHVFSHYVEAKRAEWDEYRTQVSDWEVERYLEQY